MDVRCRLEPAAPVASRPSRSRQRALDARRAPLRSSPSSRVGGTSIGAPIAIAERRCRASAPDADPSSSPSRTIDASMWNGTIGLPVALASQTAPGCATRAGPRGPSTVNAAGQPSRHLAPQLHERARAAARRRPARRAIAEPPHQPRHPLAVEVLAGHRDDAAVAEVERRREDAAVPERENRLAALAARRRRRCSAPGLAPACTCRRAPRRRARRSRRSPPP